MGTSFTNPIGRELRPRYNESSRLRSPRDSDVVPRIWQKSATVEQQLFRISQATEQVQRQLNRLRTRRSSITGGAKNPFTITQGDSWLEFNVGSGYVITTGAPFLPTGVTELDGTLNPHTITSPFTHFYFVLAILSPSSAAVSTSSTLPTFSTELIPIGWVDTDTYAADEASVIHQFWRDNVFSPCVV